MALLQEGGAEVKWQPRCHGLADWGRLAKKLQLLQFLFLLWLSLNSPLRLHQKQLRHLGQLSLYPITGIPSCVSILPRPCKLILTCFLTFLPLVKLH